MKKKIVPVVLLLVIGGGLFFYFRNQKPKGENIIRVSGNIVEIPKRLCLSKLPDALWNALYRKGRPYRRSRLQRGSD